MKEIRLKDLYLCSYLLNEKQEIIRTDREREKYWFVFEENDELNELINSYWQGKATTNIKSYVDKVRDLKDRIFSEK